MQRVYIYARFHGNADEQNARQVNITEITARFIFPERHPTLLPNAYFFKKKKHGEFLVPVYNM